ncbi:MAG: amidohydrolase family protein [Gammaproteobacteria bacterium]|nr:amidohydrolase family protein [Gammaproteobacteria bacterium]
MKNLFPSIFIFSLLLACSDASPPQLENSNQIYTGPIIDMHLHAYTEAEPRFGLTTPPLPNGDVFTASKDPEKHKSETFDQMAKNNIVKAVITSGELWKNTHSDKVIIANDETHTIEELAQLYENGNLEVMAELTPFYDGILANDESMEPYFALAEELQIPVGYHLMPGGPPGGPYIMDPDIRARNANPLQLEEVLIKHPNMKIYIMHAAWPYLDELKALMYAHPQVYVEMGAINWALPKEEVHRYLKGLVDAGYGKRIMFATDQMVWPETISAAVKAVNSASFLTLQQKEDIFYNNAARFLGLSEEEIKQHKQKKQK